MDASKSFKSSIDHLETLAALLLCKGVHNNHKSRAYLSQVDEVSTRWMVVVEEEYRIMKRQREKAKALKTKDVLLQVSESAKQMKAELEDESVNRELSKVPRNEESTRKSPFWTTEAELHDPFVATPPSMRSNSLLFSSTKPNHKQTTQAIKSTNGMMESHTSTKVEEKEIVISQSLPSLKPNTSLPTPDQTPEASKDHQKQNETTPISTPIKQRKETINENQPITPPSSIKFTKTTDLTFEFRHSPELQENMTVVGGPKSAIEPTWSFQVFNEAKEQVTSSPAVPSTQERLLPLPSLGFTAARVPLGQKSTSSHKNMKTRKLTTSQYEFGIQENIPKKDFSFEINPSQLMRITEASSKAAQSPASPSRQLFTFVHQVEEISTTLDGKNTQTVLEAQSTLKSQPISFSESISEFESVSESQLLPDKKVSMSDITTDIYQDDYDENATDIEITTPSTTIEFSTDIVSHEPASPTPKTLAQSTTKIPAQNPSSPLELQSPSPRNVDVGASFGTALIIPSSTPYKSHLPSRKTHSFTTQSRSSQNSSGQGSDMYIADLQIWERITATDKPLPSLPWEPAKKEGSCELRDNIIAVRERDEDGKDEDDGVGCWRLRSRRLSRLKKRVVLKVRGVSTRIFRVPGKSEGYEYTRNHGVELGIVTGAIIALNLVIFGVVFFRRMKKRRDAERSVHLGRAIDPEKVGGAEVDCYT
ncbi:hypothetical protein EG329_010297 [Mollisiaceae sp. DMI_Dod_QoI]|nr:hypothetical protein EG329_010297 [Helotiales sp. DMI_Dod_QoI]